MLLREDNLFPEESKTETKNKCCHYFTVFLSFCDASFLFRFECSHRIIFLNQFSCYYYLEEPNERIDSPILIF